jgi:acetyltransferase-like isoleucine patch superfamily enzyme
MARVQLGSESVAADHLVFIDDAPGPERINGHRLLSYAAFIDLPASERFVCVALASSKVRQRIVARCEADGVRPWSVSAANVVVMDDVSIGDGAILSPFVTLASNIRIGRHFHANLYSYVEHDCVIGDYVTFAPGVKCNGNVWCRDSPGYSGPSVEDWGGGRGGHGGDRYSRCAARSRRCRQSGSSNQSVKRF